MKKVFEVLFFTTALPIAATEVLREDHFPELQEWAAKFEIPTIVVEQPHVRITHPIPRIVIERCEDDSTGSERYEMIARKRSASPRQREYLSVQAAKMAAEQHKTSYIRSVIKSVKLITDDGRVIHDVSIGEYGKQFDHKRLKKISRETYVSGHSLVMIIPGKYSEVVLAMRKPSFRRYNFVKLYSADGDLLATLPHSDFAKHFNIEKLTEATNKTEDRDDALLLYLCEGYEDITAFLK